MTLILVPDSLTPADCAFLEAMAQGLVTARAKYPGPSDRFVAFAAEFGEALHAVQRIVTGRGTVRELGAELRQAAQMACRFAVEGDPSIFSSEIQTQFPIIVQPTTETKPHQPGHTKPPLIPRVCLQFGKPFQAKAADVERGYGKYCSKPCAGSARRTTKQEKA